MNELKEKLFFKLKDEFNSEELSEFLNSLSEKELNVVLFLAEREYFFEEITEKYKRVDFYSGSTENYTKERIDFCVKDGQLPAVDYDYAAIAEEMLENGEIFDCGNGLIVINGEEF